MHLFTCNHYVEILERWEPNDVVEMSDNSQTCTSVLRMFNS